MNDILKGLNEINGVIGSAIFDNGDECVAHAIPAPFEPILLSKMMKEFRSALEVMGSNDDAKEWTHLQVALEQGCIALRAVEDYTLMSIGSSALNPSMLNIGFTVASLKLSKAKSEGAVAKSSSKSWGSKSSGMKSATSFSGLTPMSDGGVRVPNAVGPAIMDALYKLLAKQLGPFAKIALKEEMAKLGATPYTMVPPQFDDLVNILARRLPAEKQKEFVTQSRALVAR